MVPSIYWSGRAERNPRYPSHNNVFDTWLSRPSHGNGVAVTAETSGDPQNIDLGYRTGMCEGCHTAKGSRQGFFNMSNILNRVAGKGGAEFPRVDTISDGTQRGARRERNPKK